MRWLGHVVLWVVLLITGWVIGVVSVETPRYRDLTFEVLRAIGGFLATWPFAIAAVITFLYLLFSRTDRAWRLLVLVLGWLGAVYIGIRCCPEEYALTVTAWKNLFTQ